MKKNPLWMKEHVPNLTGTPFAYEYKDKKDSTKIKNVYSVWKPKKTKTQTIFFWSNYICNFT